RTGVAPAVIKRSRLRQSPAVSCGLTGRIPAHRHGSCVRDVRSQNATIHPKEPTMITALPTATQTAPAAGVQALLPHIRYAPWLSKRIEAEIVATTQPPVRAMTPELCAATPLACAA